MALAIAHLADQRQDRHFEQDQVQPGAFQGQGEAPFFFSQEYIGGIETKQPQEADEVGRDEGNALEKGQLAVADGDIGEGIDLGLDGRMIGPQVFVVAAAEGPLDFRIGIVVQDGLHHGELVEIGVQQALHGLLGKTIGHHWRGSAANWSIDSMPNLPGKRKALDRLGA